MIGDYRLESGKYGTFRPYGQLVLGFTLLVWAAIPWVVILGSDISWMDIITLIVTIPAGIAGVLFIYSAIHSRTRAELYVIDPSKTVMRKMPYYSALIIPPGVHRVRMAIRPRIGLTLRKIDISVLNHDFLHWRRGIANEDIRILSMREMHPENTKWVDLLPLAKYSWATNSEVATDQRILYEIDVSIPEYSKKWNGNLIFHAQYRLHGELIGKPIGKLPILIHPEPLPRYLLMHPLNTFRQLSLYTQDVQIQVTPRACPGTGMDSPGSRSAILAH